MLEINRTRLLSVVNGDWSPYITETPIITWGVGQTETRTFLDTKTDFDLLRHDIHVLLHAAASPDANKEKNR